MTDLDEKKIDDAIESILNMIVSLSKEATDDPVGQALNYQGNILLVIKTMIEESHRRVINEWAGAKH